MSSPQMQGTTLDEQAIRNAATEFVAAWNKNDAKALTALFTTDGDLINPAGRVARGRTGVETLFTEEHNGQFKGTRLSMPQKHLHFLRQDIAIADYEYEISNVRGSDGKETSIRGLVSSVLHKNGDKWLIAACRAMTPAPLPGSRR